MDFELLAMVVAYFPTSHNQAWIIDSGTFTYIF